MRTRIKICCISSIEEAGMAMKFGADAIGLVGAMPSGPGPIADDLIAQIAMHVSPPVASFLLTSEQSAASIVRHLQKVHTNTVQIVDELAEGKYHEIRSAIPAIRIVQVIHVIDGSSIEEAIRIGPHVDALLLDSGNPRALVKTLGGTGNTHNWSVSSQIVRSVQVPVFLAGGLHAGNVRDAIAEVQPFAVDVCSGVRTHGNLDPDKLEKFINAVNAG